MAELEPVKPEPAAEDAPGEGDTAPEEPQYITAQAHNESIEKLSRDNKAALGRLNKAFNDLSEKLVDAEQPDDAQPEDAKEPPSVKAERTKLKKREAELMALQEKTKLSAVRSNLTSELQKAGINPDALKVTVDAIMSRNQKNVSVELGDLGEQTITVETGDGTTTLTDFVSEFVKGDGKAFLIPKVAPNMPGTGGGGTGGKIKVTQADINAGRVTPEQMKSGNYEYEEE